jgi:hypothetical protein
VKKRSVRLFIEPLIWLAFIIFPIILFPTLQPFIDKGMINPPLKGLLITHSLLIVFYYFNYFYALPKYYFARRYSTYFSVIISCLMGLLIIMLSDASYNPLPSPPFRYATMAFIFSILVRFVMILLLSLGIASYNRLQQAEEDRLKSELSYLKAQINPHFLFNTLNSIYALAVQKSDAAPESVTKLAAIMRYVITDAASDLVSLEKEINYVSSYIELEKLRLTSRVSLQYNVTGNFVGHRISPMVLIPLVENAFKHGVSTSEDSQIEINIRLESKTLTLHVRNTKIKRDKADSTGLGIENVKRRLNLLYTGKHDLSISETEKDFSANLVLILHD